MNPKIFTAAIAIFGTGLIGGYVLHDVFGVESESADTISKQVRQIGSYTYINPLLECEVADGTIDARKQNFQADLQKFTQSVKQTKGLTEIAVYFRDLNNGPAFGVDEAGEFFPASLLKVPVMMVYYRWSEVQPNLLDIKLPYDQPVDFGVSLAIKPKVDLVPGQAYSVAELIEHMILYSDNQALYLLVQRLPQEKIIDLLRIIGIGDDVVKDRMARLTVKEYAGLFRILFNGSYLSHENSEKALELLARTDYRDGLPGKLPQGITVSHKFGEAGTGSSERQLHDCGIVYFPDHPYLACVMTRSKSETGLKEAIQDVSKFIYDKVDEQY